MGKPWYRILPILAALAVVLLPGAVSFGQAPPAVPALPDTERRTAYSLSSQIGPFSVGFALYGDSTDYGDWLELWLITGSGTSTVATKLTATTDWTLSSATGSLATIPRPITDATVTLTTARTGTLQIVGARRPRRTAQFAENRGVAARDLNQALTDIVATQRETWDRTIDIAGRALQVAPGDTFGCVVPATAVRAGGILAFDTNGCPIIQSALTGLGNVVGPNVAVVGHIATYGNTAGTVLLDGGLVGAGNLVGPSPSVSGTNHVATWKDTGGINVKDSGLTLTPSTGTFTLTNAKTLTVDNSLEFAGVDGTVMTFPGTSATIARTDAANTFTGTQTIGALVATTVNGNTLTAGTYTLTGTAAKILNFTNSLTLSGTDSTTMTFPSTSATIARTDAANTFTGTQTIGALVATTVNGNTVTTGTGTLTLNAKTLTVANTGTLGGGDGFTLAIAAAKTLTVSNSLTFTGTDATSFAFPSTSDTVVTLTAAQTLTTKTLTAPTINGGTAQALTNLGIRSSGSGAFDMVIANTENLTAQRALTLTLNNAARAISLSGNLTLAAGLTTAGGSAITLTATGATNVTLPTAGLLATQDQVNSFSSPNVFSAVQQFTDAKFSSGKIYPTGDSTTALQVTKADGTTRVVDIDTTNARIGINKTPGAFDLDVNGAANIGGTLTFPTTTITSLTANNTPNSSNDYFMYFSAADGAMRKCTVGACAAAATAGVASLNGLTGGLSIVAGYGLSVSASGSSVTLAAALQSPHCGRLAYSSTTAVTFKPYSCEQIRINGTMFSIPAAGITGCTTSPTFVNGTGSSSLSSSTLYYVYAFSNSGTVTCDFRTDGNGHLPSDTAGNIGTEVRVSSGTTKDDTRTLIGMVYTDGSFHFNDSDALRNVTSWFNRKTTRGTNKFTANRTTTSAFPVEINTEIRIEFLIWNDQTLTWGAGGPSYTSSGSGTSVITGAAYDGTSLIAGCISDFFASSTVNGNVGLTCSNSSLSEGHHYVTVIGGTTGGNNGTWGDTGSNANILFSQNIAIN